MMYFLSNPLDSCKNLIYTVGVIEKPKLKEKGVRKMSMKSTGIVRKVDRLGRIVLPKELRDTMKIGHEDPLEIYVKDECIILKKYEPACLFCGNATDVITFMDKKICRECAEKLKEM